MNLTNINEDKLFLDSDPDHVLAVARFVSTRCYELNIKHQICGSIRREVPPHDVDIVVDALKVRRLTKNWQNITKLLYPEYREQLGEEQSSCESYLVYDVKVDVLRAYPDQFNFATLFLTGDRWFGECLREQARRKGWMLGPLSLSDPYTGIRKTGMSEEEILSFLGVPWVEPKDRETYL